MKQSTNFFDTSIRVQQIGLADLIFLLEFLLQNSTIVFIQERGEGKRITVRPCKAGICWYGTIDNSLVNAHSEVKILGLDSEIVHQNKICNAESDSMLLDSDYFLLVDTYQTQGCSPTCE